MAITRQGPVMNMDADQELKFIPVNQRFTRAQAHRLLKKHNVEHGADWPMERLTYAIQMANIQPTFVPPGVMGEEPVVDLLPNNVPKLRAMCKKLDIPFKNTDNMITLKGYLNG